MRLDRILLLECQDIFSYLPFEVYEDDLTLRIAYRPEIEKLFWKGHKLQLSVLSAPAQISSYLQIEDQEIVIPKQILVDPQELRIILQFFSELRENLLKENLQCAFWSRPQHIVASGFEEGTLKRSDALLAELYERKLMVPEKKKFLVDLWKSTSSYLVADEDTHTSFLDAASQIASLAIGHNNRVRNALLLRPELQDADQDFSKWDVARGFKRILIQHSKLNNVYLVNSGAEAMETALRSCQSHYTQRRRILAFEGSFHGRTLLALHTTHSPSKRLPFEIYKDLVSFLPFPEDKTPHIPKKEPESWIATWASSHLEDFDTKISALMVDADDLLKSEIQSLRLIREEFLKELPLAVVIEPMQCEGGDRYATARFFRALRLLTRAHDVALVIDEVQTGFGLGGPFFWHSSFDLIDAQGQADTPDALCVAKKAQVGACVTRFEMPDFKDETSPASLHRGYLQAVEILQHNTHELEKKVRHQLELLCKHLGTHAIIHPRNQGYAFAFDLSEPKILTALVSKRFPHGLLFYPAGEQTARFRLWIGIQDYELLEIFSGLYRCFEDLQDEGLIKLHSNYSDWLKEHPEELVRKISKPNFETHSIWPEIFTKLSVDKLDEITAEKWDRIYHKIVGVVPQLLLMAPSSPYSLSQRPQSLNQLVERYKSETFYTRLDLMWDCARFFGTRLELADTEMLKKLAPQIDALQAKTYEPARQTPSSEFIQYSREKKSIIHVALENNNLIGISGAAPASLFSTLPLLDRDPEGLDDNCLYSYDLTLDQSAQGKGLGFRFKCEQLIEALRLGCTAIKSRNRYPEAKTMARLNLRLSGIVTDVNEKDYGGKGCALYQSLSFKKSHNKFHIGDLLEGSLKNKMTLSNFVSRHYVRNTQILAEVLPASLRHLYYASGRAEAVDKSLRLLRYFRPKGLQALSLENSYFGQSTACARSLGGPWAHKFFDWPVFENAKELSQFLSSKHTCATLLGFYAETPDPSQKNFIEKVEDLKAISALCQKHQIPFVLAEYKTAFWKNNSGHFCLAEHVIPCDALLIFAGHQLGVLAVRESLFLDKPLMLISTWDGDELSLALLKKKILSEMPPRFPPRYDSKG
jgi:4-aminobutyrate aminotransferase-like enzyme